jgi:copper(I)-binding protein
MIFEASNEAVAGRCGIVATLALGAYIGLSRVHREPVAENSCTAVIHPWAKGGAAAGGAMAAYVVLENGGATLERLLAISSPMAEQIVMMEVG